MNQAPVGALLDLRFRKKLDYISVSLFPKKLFC